MKNVTDIELQRVEAFIIGNNDHKAKHPEKNFTEIVPRELIKDSYSTLILQGGTNEVSNLDVSGNTIDNIEALKEEIKASSEKMFRIAEQSLNMNKDLENVVILKRMFRCDTLLNDPAQIKAKLSDFGNRVLDDIWLTKGCPKNIRIVQQELDCQDELRISRFGFPSAKGYDGIHMRGKMAVQHYTGSIVNVLLNVLPNNNPTSKTSKTPKVNIFPQPPTYANMARKNIPKVQPNKFMFNPPNFASRPFFNFPQTESQKSGQFTKFAANGSEQLTSRPTTGSNKIPVGRNYQYNVPTQNRFSAVSGN